MKPITSTFSKFIFLALLFLTLGGKAAYAQEAKIHIDSLNHLADKAVQIVDITLDDSLIKMAAMFLNDKKPDEAKIKEMLTSIQGVFVKRFEFEQEGVFTEGDVSPIRSQLQNPGWSRIVSYINRKKDGHKMNVEVFLMTQGSIIKGLAVLATEDKAVTVANLVGPIDLQKLAQLEGRFGIPNIGLKQATGQPAETDKDTDNQEKKPVRKNP
jgi:hypothetical protein